ncbi:BglG family transcriptional antiterminator [Bacillus oleivorans]|uniref:BglG family transcriptional antiterminator n=1 Tax=Bacillus oleivorans TaxID=1448271 RepID=A0A285CK90_9BACI|nr:BglG family transcription antiterminator [Bacillus oleivorans]SNX68004.1 BglG family transcriptional antiterminator [Bacillus oleivorans]
MSLDKRSIAILSHLVEAKSYVPIKELMEKFKISRRTIYYDIDKVNGWLKENKLEPVKHVRGEGFKLEENTALQIPEKIKLFRTWQYEFSAKERKAWLALYLLGRDTALYLEDLMEKTRVSRNTTLDDLKVLKGEIERFHLSLDFDRKTGYAITGDEDDKRKAIVYYLSTVLPNEGWQTLLSKIPFILNRSDTNSEEHINLFNSDELKAVQHIVAESEKDLNIQFTDDFFHSLTFRLMFFGKRLMQGKKVQINQVEKEVLSETKEYQAACKLAQKLSKVLNVEFPQDEIFYITKHLLSSRVQFSKDISEESGDSDSQILTEVVSNMVTDFQKYACVFFKDKELLVRNLLVHVKPSFYRIKYGLEVENQVAESLKEKYPDIFLLTKKVIHHLEKAVGKPVHENEIALIAMYFGGWMRRAGVKPANRKKVIIVCGSGLGTSKLLETQLEGLFSTIDIIGSVSLREFEHNDYEVDFIFSTTPVQKQDKPVFIVSPILTEAEKESLLKKVNALMDANVIQKQNSVDALLDIIKKHTNIVDQKNLEKELRQYLTKPKSNVQVAAKPSLQDLLKREYIHFIKEVKDWKEAIRAGAIPLLNRNHITEDYVEAMIDSVMKYGPYIVIAPKVAIPHANPEDGVKKLGMSLLCLEKGVRFSDSRKHDVQVVIVLAAIDGETHLTALSQLTKMFTDPENLNEIMESHSLDRILEMIKAYSH